MSLIQSLELIHKLSYQLLWGKTWTQSSQNTVAWPLVDIGYTKKRVSMLPSALSCHKRTKLRPLLHPFYPSLSHLSSYSPPTPHPTQSMIKS